MKKIESIVLVDDDSVDNFISKKLLESFGITDIIVFESPILALDYITKRTNPLDILIVDLYMPLMNGFEFIESIKNLMQLIMLQIYSCYLFLLIQMILC